MKLAGKTYWLVGASEGLGRALAQKLDRRGVRLVLSARNADRLHELAAEFQNEASVVPLDVADAEAVKHAHAMAGDLDGVIYCAGIYEPMRAQEWNGPVVEKICDINFMGAVRVLGAVVPDFTRRDRGHVVVVGSLSGYRGLPGAIGYGASKAAVMHLTETLQTDLCRTNVRVQLFNPGFIKTRLTDKNSFNMPFLLTAEDAAGKIADGMETTRFKVDFPWVFSMVFRLSRLLPQRLYELIFARHDKT